MKIKIKNIFKKVEKENIVKNKEEEKVELKYRRKGAILEDNKLLKENKEKIKKLENKEVLKNFFKNKNKISKSYYTLMLFMIILCVASLILVFKSHNISTKENYDTYIAKDEIAVSSSADNNIIINKDLEKLNSNTIIKTDSKKEEKPKVIIPKVIPLSFKKPLNGEISKMFSIDKVIYSKTLELWKTHDGVDIKGEISTNVISIEKGNIEKVYEDAFYGITIVIDHGQGYKSSYSNLDKNVKVKEKQFVSKGQIIGKIGNTSIGEIKDESHLHFMLFKNNNLVDPTFILK